MAKIKLVRDVIDSNGQERLEATIFEAEPTFNSQWLVTEGNKQFTLNCRDTEEVDGES